MIAELSRKINSLSAELAPSVGSAAGISVNLGLFKTIFLAILSGIDSNVILSDRLYRGCAILWWSNMFVEAENVDGKSRRLCALRLHGNGWSLILIIVYVSYESDGKSTGDFPSQLGELAAIQRVVTKPGFHVELVAI